MYDSVKERIKAYLKAKNITAISFCQKIGVSQSYISSMRESLQPDKIKSIVINFPELNIGWLMTGVGNMENLSSEKITEIEEIKIKRESENITISKEVFDLLKHQSETILSQQRTIEKLILQVQGNDVPLEGAAMNADVSGFSEK